MFLTALTSFSLALLISHVWIRYAKYIFTGLYSYLAQHKIFNEYLRCYACVSFWIFLFSYFLISFISPGERFLFSVILSSFSTLFFTYHFETSKLFSYFRDNFEVISIVLLFIFVFIVSFFVPIFAFAVISSFLVVAVANWFLSFLNEENRA